MKLFLFLVLAPLTGILLWRNFDIKNRTPEFNDTNCVRAIIGEYAVNDYKGLKLIAHAIRNRGTLRGVYGFYAKHINEEPKEIWVEASLAWVDSANEFDPLDGANEWRSQIDLKKHGRPKRFTLTKIYNGIYFYKPIKKGPTT